MIAMYPLCILITLFNQSNLDFPPHLSVIVIVIFTYAVFLLLINFTAEGCFFVHKTPTSITKKHLPAVSYQDDDDRVIKDSQTFERNCSY